MRRLLFVLAALLVLVGCSQSAELNGEPTPRPTATIAPFFGGAAQVLPDVMIPTALPRPTSSVEASAPDDPFAPVNGQRDPLSDLVVEVPIFDDGLDANWSLEYSFDQLTNARSGRYSASGATALEVVPLAPFGGVVFTLSESSRNLYPRADIMGVRFAVSGGAAPLAPHNLIVKVLGSNRYPFHVEGDNSVPRPDWLRADKPIFDEVGLDTLGMQRTLEPGEWAEVDLWLDTYDQVTYTYVTGLVIFNDELFMRPFYIDNVRLLVRR